MSKSSKVAADREILVSAQSKGPFSTLGAYLRLSGPGWLQSAITLGGGSLGSALYLGVLGGTSMLWLNIIAIVVGVIMLSAISYVVLSSGERPYKAINEHVNPILGVGWITATMMANIIWCMPQFSLCFDVLDNNLLAGTAAMVDTAQAATASAESAENAAASTVVASGLSDTSFAKYGVSVLLFIPAFIMVWMSLSGGRAVRIFDLLLKLLIGTVVVCFVAVVVRLTMQDELNWNAIAQGLIPDFTLWLRPAPEISGLIFQAPESVQQFWTEQIMKNQRDVMISTTATVVGINMTFLLPYSMLSRGWDKPFRGLARFDLITGMAIPFVLVTGCIVIASAYSFHAEADEQFLSADVEEIRKSRLFEGSVDNVLARAEVNDPSALDELDSIEDAQQLSEARTTLAAQVISEMTPEERKLAATLVKPNAGQLAQSLAPLLGARNANLVFGLGAFGMGFSTIIILMMINGFAFGELFGAPDNKFVRILGASIAGVVGVCWPAIWAGESKTWLIIMASTFGAILLPIAYISFFALMNSRSLLRENMPTGGRRFLWNFLMVFGVIAALAQAGSSLYTKLIDPKTNALITPDTGSLVFGGVVTFALLAIIGFSAAFSMRSGDNTESNNGT